VTDVLLQVGSGLVAGWLLARHGRRVWFALGRLFRRPLPAYIVREEPTNVVRYAGKDLEAAKRAYHGTPVAAGLSLNFYAHGKNRGIRHAYARGVRGTGERLA